MGAQSDDDDDGKKVYGSYGLRVRRGRRVCYIPPCMLSWGLIFLVLIPLCYLVGLMRSPPKCPVYSLGPGHKAEQIRKSLDERERVALQLLPSLPDRLKTLSPKEAQSLAEVRESVLLLRCGLERDGTNGPKLSVQGDLLKTLERVEEMLEQPAFSADLGIELPHETNPR